MSAARVLSFHHRNARDLKAHALTERAREAQRKAKIDRAAHVLDQLEERAAEFDRQIKALQARKAHVCGRAERLEDQILTLMRRASFCKLEGNRRTLAARPSPSLTLQVDNEALIPREFLRVKTEPMKVEIKAALARGEDIAGVRLTQKVSLVRK